MNIHIHYLCECQFLIGNIDMLIINCIIIASTMGICKLARNPVRQLAIPREYIGCSARSLYHTMYDNTPILTDYSLFVFY